MDMVAVLQLPQNVQSRMADPFCKTRCASPAWHRYLLSTAWTHTTETPVAVCNLAYAATHAPRRFRKRWQELYDARARLLRERWGLPRCQNPSSSWSCLALPSHMRTWLCSTCVASGTSSSPQGVMSTPGRQSFPPACTRSRSQVRA